MVPVSSSTTRLVAVLLIGAGLGYGLTHVLRCSRGSGAVSSQHCFLRTTLRRLWADHVIWTRNYLISSIGQLEDLADVTERLLKNQADIGAAVGMYYGKDAGNKLADLLKEHILLAAKVVDAAKAHDKEALAKANEAWYKNAQDMAKFLSMANPQWTYDMLIKMFDEHLKLTTDEAVARIQKQWKNDIAAFDAVFNEILAMSDELTTGIVQQFPHKF